MWNLELIQGEAAVQLKERIELLEADLSQILSNTSGKIRRKSYARRGRKAGPRATQVSGNRDVGSPTKTRRRKMSAAARGRIAAAAKARWEKAKEAGKNSLAG